MPDTAQDAAASGGATDALYRGLVADRARHPRHAGALEAPCETAEGSNPLCGDRVVLSLRCDPSGAIDAVRHQTDGCAICMAAADLLAESVAGLTRPAVRQRWQAFALMLQDGAAALDAEDRQALGLLTAFADLHEYRSRRKCAILPWSALLTALETGEK